MKNVIRITVLGLSLIVFGYFIYFIFNIVKYAHRSAMSDDRTYYWMFNDSIDQDIEFMVSLTKKGDILSHYNYKNQYFISIWEFKDFGGIELKDVYFNKNVSLAYLRFKKFEVLNSGGSPQMMVKFGYKLPTKLNINIDQYSKITKMHEGSNYKWVYGEVHKLSLSDAINGNFIVIDYLFGNKPTFLLTYKPESSLYLITIRSDTLLTEDALKILKLKLN